MKDIIFFSWKKTVLKTRTGAAVMSGGILWHWRPRRCRAAESLWNGKFGSCMQHHEIPDRNSGGLL